MRPGTAAVRMSRAHLGLTAAWLALGAFMLGDGWLAGAKSEMLLGGAACLLAVTNAVLAKRHRRFEKRLDDS